MNRQHTRCSRQQLCFHDLLAELQSSHVICLQGTLAALNSRNPVLYIDFPEGRLKFFGTLTFPRNRYMVLRFGNKDVVCEDVLENMVSRHAAVHSLWNHIPVMSTCLSCERAVSWQMLGLVCFRMVQVT